MVTFRASSVHQPGSLSIQVGISLWQQTLHFRNGFSLPMAGEVVECAEAHTAHPVHIKRARQMIDLVLQDTRMPARGPDDFRLSLGIEAFDLHLACPGYQGDQARQAQAALKKLDLRL